MERIRAYFSHAPWKAYLLEAGLCKAFCPDPLESVREQDALQTRALEKCVPPNALESSREIYFREVTAVTECLIPNCLQFAPLLEYDFF